MQHDAAAVRAWIDQAPAVAVLTGAGVSAESGVPTFRDAQTGLWAQFRPEELATEAAFRGDPERVWNWYAMRRALLARVAPNDGHRALAAFQQRHPGRLTLVTQNVDGLHEQAGSVGVLALHGTLAADRWLDTPARCCEATATVSGSPPRCSGCGNLRRPAVVWFGEQLPADTLAAAERAARSCALMLVAGTSGAVFPAAGLADTARRAGARVVVFNPQRTELDGLAHALLRGSAARLLPLLFAG